MARGFEQRAVGCHDVNAHSSRSHCLLVVRVAATDPATGAPPARAPEAGLQVSTPSVRPTWEEKHISKQAGSPRCSVRPGPASACAPPHDSLAGASCDQGGRTGPFSGFWRAGALVAEPRRLCAARRRARGGQAHALRPGRVRAHHQDGRDRRAPGCPRGPQTGATHRSSQRGHSTLCMQPAPVRASRLCARRTCFVVVRSSRPLEPAGSQGCVQPPGACKVSMAGFSKRVAGRGLDPEAHARVGPLARRAGLTLTEAQNINRSLLELGNVISALMQNASHVPYRRAPASARVHACARRGRIAPRSRACYGAAGRACWSDTCAHIHARPPSCTHSGSRCLAGG